MPKRAIVGRVSPLPVCATPWMVLVCILFLAPLNAAFSLPDPEAIKKRIEETTRDIREKGPGMQALAAWHKAWSEAEKEIETARKKGATRYAPERYAEATELLKRAKVYAGQRLYLKAEYLARQATQSARAAQETARMVRSEKLDEARKRIDSIGKRISELEKRRETFPLERQREIDRVILAWRDLIHALAIEEFDVIDERIPEIEKRLDTLAK